MGTKLTYVNNLQGADGGETMPRPKKGRRVCCLPGIGRFGPLEGGVPPNQEVFMTVEEHETIRLIDLKGFTQEECAEQMQVARTTVQRIYNDARKKVAEALVLGKMLQIEGGDYLLCGGLERTCRCGDCQRRPRECAEEAMAGHRPGQPAQAEGRSGDSGEETP